MHRTIDLLPSLFNNALPHLQRFSRSSPTALFIQRFLSEWVRGRPISEYHLEAFSKPFALLLKSVIACIISFVSLIEMRRRFMRHSPGDGRGLGRKGGGGGHIAGCSQDELKSVAHTSYSSRLQSILRFESQPSRPTVERATEPKLTINRNRCRRRGFES